MGILNIQALMFIGAMAIVFIMGWDTKRLQDEAADRKELQKQIEATQLAQKQTNAVAAHYEETVAAWSANYNDINQKLKATYANSAYRCTIPADGLRLLAQATTR